MRRGKLRFALGMLALVLAAGPSAALPPPPSAPFTLWNFLGIPQGFRKIRDASVNRAGNHPGAERLPPLKAIADPENLKSENPAIKAAAEIKSEEDLAPQKIKALKYLATVGCDSGCYPEVKKALMAALGDCTEEVRYQAVLAIQDAVTQHCAANEQRQRHQKRKGRRDQDDDSCACNCDTACCCGEDMSLALSERAYNRDDNGCFVEPSERVREAAKAVLASCCPNTGPIAPTEGDEDEAPAPPREPAPEGIPTPTPVPPTAPEDSSVWRSRTLPPGGPQRFAAAGRSPHKSRLFAALASDMLGSDVAAPGSAGRLPAPPTQPVGTFAPHVARGPDNLRGPQAARGPVNTVRRPTPARTEATRVLPRANAEQPPRLSSAPGGASGPAASDSNHEPQGVAVAVSDRPAPALGYPASRRGRQAAADDQPPGLAVADDARPAQLAFPASLDRLAPARSAASEARVEAVLVSAVEAHEPLPRLDDAVVPAVNEVPRRASLYAPRQRVEARVARVDATADTLELHVVDGGYLLPGDRLRLTHQYLLKEATVGYVEVVGTDAGIAARPLGRLNLGKVARGDRATFVPGGPRPASGVSAAADFAVVPAPIR